MKNSQRKMLLSFVIASTLNITACGGGSSDSGNGNQANNANTNNGTATPSTPKTVDEQLAQYLSDLTDIVIIPAYSDLNIAAIAQQNTIESFCTNSTGTNTDLELLRTAWRELDNSWQHISWLKVGAIGKESRQFRMQMWPDPNNAVERGVESLLIDPNEILIEKLENHNVGGQGIPALEYLYFPANQENNLIHASDKDKRCEVARVISQNIVNMTSDVFNDWRIDGGDFASHVKAGTGEFTSQKDAVEEIVSDWLETFEVVKDQKLLKPLSTAKPGNPEYAEHYLSDYSAAAIKANLTAFNAAYYVHDGLGLDSILAEPLELLTIKQQIDDAMSEAQTAGNALSTSLNTDLATDDGREKLNNAIESLTKLRALMLTELVQALDLALGFNANDGD